MAERESYLRMLPTGVREPLRKLFASNAALTNSLVISNAVTTGITLSAAMTDGILISGAMSDNAIEITSACTGSAIMITGACTGPQIGIGASGTPVVDDGASAEFVSFFFDCGSTAGWPAGLYVKTNVTGAAGSFTNIQDETTITAAKANVSGIDSYFTFGVGGRVTGRAAAFNSAMAFANEAKSGGVYSAMTATFSGGGAACDLDAATRVHLYEFKTEGTWANSWEARAQATYMMYFNGFTAASGVANVLSSSSPNPFPAGTRGIRVGIGADSGAGTAYYIPLLESADWTTSRLDLVNVSSSGCTDGSVIRMGTTGSKLTDDQAGAGFIVGNFDQGATSGWPCTLLLRTAVTGVGGSYSSIQDETTVSVAKATVSGIDTYYTFANGGRVTGKAATINAAMAFSNEAKSSGTYAGICTSFSGGGGSCDLDAATRVALLELKTEGTWANSWEERAQATYAIYFNGFTGAAGTSNILTTTTLTIGAGDPANVIGIRVGVGPDSGAGTAYYIPLIPASEWN